MSHAYVQKIKLGLTFHRYMYSRFARLYPLHLFVLLATLPLIIFKYITYANGLGGTDPSLTENPYTFFSTLFLLHSIGFKGGFNFPSWSISAEVFAYIFFFFCVKYIFCRNNKVSQSIYLPLTIALLFYGFAYWEGGAFQPYTWDFGVLRSIPAFLVGVASYRIFIQLKLEASKFNTTKTILLEIFIVLTTIFCVSNLSGSGNYWGYISVVCFAFCIVLFARTKNGVFGYLLESPSVKKMGVYSYSIYLVHMPILDAVQDFYEHILNIRSNEVTGFEAFFVNIAQIGIVILVSHFTY